MTVDDELFSILATVVDRRRLPRLLDAFGWTGPEQRRQENASSGDLDPRAIEAAARQAKTDLDAVPFWTPALDRAAEHVESCPQASREAAIAALHRAGIVEHEAFDPDGLALAFKLLGPTVPPVFRASRMELDALWSKRSRKERIAARAADHLVARAIARELLAARAQGVDEQPESLNSTDEARAWEDRIQTILDQTASEADFPEPALDVPVDARLGAALAQISAWAVAERQATTVGEALDCVRAAETPPIRVSRAWDRLREMDAREAGRAYWRVYDPVAAVERIEESFAPGANRHSSDRARMWRVLTRRVINTQPSATLEELGRELGVTRERVRQIEVKARDELLRAVAARANMPLVRAAHRARIELGSVVPVADYQRYLASRFDVDLAPDALRELTGQLVLWLAGPYRRIDDGWLAVGKLNDLMDESNALLWSATIQGPMLEDDAATRLSNELGIEPRHARAWIASLGRYRFQNGWLSRWSGSFADKAEQVLLLAGEPLTRVEIVEQVGKYGSRGPIGVLPSDPRFTRVSLTHIALSEWGLDEYSTIEEELAKEIDRQGGNASAAHLVETLAGKFDVAEQSVRMYLANGPGFSRDAAGNYHNIAVPTNERDVKPIWLSGRCFYSGGQWAYRHEVTQETLRGSGSGISTPFAVYMGAERQGQAIQLSTPYGPVRITRTTTMTTISTLRAIANAFVAAPGDCLFLRRAGPDSLDVLHAPANARKGQTGFHRLAIECGLDHPEAASLPDICQAIGLDADSSLNDLARRFKRRMESNLIAFMPATAD